MYGQSLLHQPARALIQSANCLCHAFKRQCTFQSPCKNASRMLLAAHITLLTIQVNLNSTSLHKPRGKSTLTSASEWNTVTAFYTLTTRYTISVWMPGCKSASTLQRPFILYLSSAAQHGLPCTLSDWPFIIRHWFDYPSPLITLLQITPFPPNLICTVVFFISENRAVNPMGNRFVLIESEWQNCENEMKWQSM